MMAYEHITIGSNCYDKAKTLKYFGCLLTNQNYIHEEIKCRLKEAERMKMNTAP